MVKPSTHYRTDGTDGLDPVIKAYLDDHYLRNLKNLDGSNPKLLVVFSGGNAMGKTTIARKIEQRYSGVVLENDEVKRCLLQLMPGATRDVLSPITWQYTMGLYARLGELTHNGLIVRDGVIDWYYDRILPVFERMGYELFVIGFDLSRHKAVELIRARGDTPTVKEERFYELLDDHVVHTKRFRQAYTPDVLLTDATVFDHGRVLELLGHRLARLRG